MSPRLSCIYVVLRCGLIIAALSGPIIIVKTCSNCNHTLSGYVPSRITRRSKDNTSESRTQKQHKTTCMHGRDSCRAVTTATDRRIVVTTA